MEGPEQPPGDDHVFAGRDAAAYLHADDDKPEGSFWLLGLEGLVAPHPAAHPE